MEGRLDILCSLLSNIEINMAYNKIIYTSTFVFVVVVVVVVVVLVFVGVLLLLVKS